MYFILKNNLDTVYSIQTLSQKLEIKPRQIITYKNDLQIAGVDILTKRGRNGGYYMNVWSDKR